MRNELISVIIPTYNRANLIPRAINCVLNQTYKQLELIIINDGSLDNTDEVVERHKQNDKRIILISYAENKGASYARNKGLEIAKGEYVAFLDSDDEWFPKKLELQLNKFETSSYSNLGAVYCGMIIRRKNEESGLVNFYSGNILGNLLRNEIGFSGSNCLVRKKVFEECGNFDENKILWAGGGEDTEMYMRIAKKYDFDCVKEKLVVYNLGNDDHWSEAVTWLKKAMSIEYRIIKYFKDYEKYPQYLSNMLRIIGNTYCHSGDFMMGKTLLIKSLKYNFLNFKSYLFLFIALLGRTFYRWIFASFKKELLRLG